MDEYFETRERDQIINELLSTLGGKKAVYGSDRKTFSEWDFESSCKCSSHYYRGPCRYPLEGNVKIVDAPGREEKVIRMLFGMEPYSRSHTEKEIAVELDVTKSRVVDIVRIVLRKLRHPTRSASLKIFLEN
jgi:hypothetical protein